MIRRATKDDTGALRALYDEFHAFHVRGIPDYLRVPAPGEADPAEFARAVERLTESGEATLFVAELRGRLVGLAEVYLDPLHKSPFVVSRCTATLQSLFVTEACRGTASDVRSSQQLSAGRQIAAQKRSRRRPGSSRKAPSPSTSRSATRPFAANWSRHSPRPHLDPPATKAHQRDTAFLEYQVAAASISPDPPRRPVAPAAPIPASSP